MTVSSPIDGMALGHEFPASSAQQRELRAGKAFPRALVLTLSGSVDPEALARSLLRLRQRHEVLRTVLRMSDGAWHQLVLDDAAAMGAMSGALADSAGAVGRLDYGDQPTEAAAVALETFVRELAEACQAEGGPLFRMALVRMGAQEHACVLAASSLVLDSFSFELLLPDLGSLYRAETLASGSPVPEPELQYADCVLWEQAMEGARAEAWTAPVSGKEARDGRDVSASGAAGRMAGWHEQALGSAAAAQLLLAGTSAGALLAVAVAAVSGLLEAGSPKVGLLASGRTLPELTHTLGPLHRAAAIYIDTAMDPGLDTETDPDQNTVRGIPAALLAAEAGKALALAREQARFGAVTVLPRPALLLVESPLLLHPSFAPGIEAGWGSPALLSPVGPLPGAGADLAVRVLLTGSEQGPPGVRLGLWSWSLGPEQMEQVSNALAATLEHLLLHPELPLPAVHVPLPVKAPLPVKVPLPPGVLARAEPFARPPSAAAEPLPSAELAPRSAQAGAADKDDAPQGEIESTLASIWSAVLQVPSVGRHEDFFDLGGHSLLAVRIGTRIEKAFGKEIPLNAILEQPTIARFARLLEEAPAGETPGATPEARRHRLVPIQEPKAELAARTPLFWIPGGRAISVLALREVSLLLGPDRPVYGVESRLPEQGEGFLSVPVRAEQYIELLRHRQPHGPYLLAGFCVGGMVAFEMAQQLRQQGEQVGFLGLLQASMPGFPGSPGLRRKMERQRQFYLARTTLSFLLQRVSPMHRRAQREAQQQVLDRFAKLLTGWVGTSSQLPETTQQSNGQTMKSYRPTTYPGALHIFLAQDCFESAGIEPALDPRRAWTTVAGGGAEIVVVPGDHVSMLTQAPARALAEAMRSVLPL